MNVAANGFDGLVAQMGEAFNKAQALDDDSKIVAVAGDSAAAGEAGGDAGVGGADATDAGNAGATGSADDEQFGKSFEFELADGTKVQAFNGEEILKSFNAKLEQITSGSQAALTSALAVINKQNEVIEKQGHMLKSLQTDVTRLANSGAGRKSVVVTQTQASEDFNKSHSTESSAPELLTKCLSAQALGKISAFDSSRANIAVEMGMPIPPDIVARLA